MKDFNFYIDLILKAIEEENNNASCGIIDAYNESPEDYETEEEIENAPYYCLFWRNDEETDACAVLDYNGGDLIITDFTESGQKLEIKETTTEEEIKNFIKKIIK